LKLSTFERRADEATSNLFAFAKFVAETEDLSGDSRYAAAWLEAEVVNAAALEAWDAQGRPQEWNDEWQRNFKAEATEVVAQLREVIKAVFD
jgi:hypothetical protein